MPRVQMDELDCRVQDHYYGDEESEFEQGGMLESGVSQVLKR